MKAKGEGGTLSLLNDKDGYKKRGREKEGRRDVRVEVTKPRRTRKLLKRVGFYSKTKPTLVAERKLMRLLNSARRTVGMFNRIYILTTLLIRLPN
jgi:hypothetical protein